jgi:hypothetical protein
MKMKLNKLSFEIFLISLMLLSTNYVRFVDAADDQTTTPPPTTTMEPGNFNFSFLMGHVDSLSSCCVEEKVKVESRISNLFFDSDFFSRLIVMVYLKMRKK